MHHNKYSVLKSNQYSINQPNLLTQNKAIIMDGSGTVQNTEEEQTGQRNKTQICKRC